MIWLCLTWLAAPLLWLRLAFRHRHPIGRVLVIQTAKIGDFVATTPVFTLLRERLPTVEIVALLHPVNVPLARQLSTIDRIVTLPPGGVKGWSGKRWLIQQLIADVDAVVILSPNLINVLLPFWAGIQHRIAVQGDRRQGSIRVAWPFLTYGEAHRPGRLFRETALRALAGLGIDVDSAALAIRPGIAASAAGWDAATEWVASVSPPRVGFGLGAGNRMKALDPGQTLELARKILARTSATLILIGTTADQPVAEVLCATLPPGRVIDTTGQWTLEALPALLATLDCFVGVDSGATYMADALGVPVVDFMGPADASDQRPTGARAIVIVSDEPCAPCSHAFDAPYTCRLGTRACVIHAPLLPMVEAVVSHLKS